MCPIPDYEGFPDVISSPASGVPLWLPDKMHDEAFGGKENEQLKRDLQDFFEERTDSGITKRTDSGITKWFSMDKNGKSYKLICRWRDWYNSKLVYEDKSKYRSANGYYVAGSTYTCKHGQVRVFDHAIKGDIDLVFNLCDQDDKDKTSTVPMDAESVLKWMWNLDGFGILRIWNTSDGCGILLMDVESF